MVRYPVLLCRGAHEACPDHTIPVLVSKPSVELALPGQAEAASDHMVASSW